MRWLLHVCGMNYKAAIFDMDGLLIDSEPLWQQAGKETLQNFGIELTEEQYHSSTGLRTEEWIEHWFHYFKIDKQHALAAIETIIQKAISKIEKDGILFPGVYEIADIIRSKGLLLGLATSSPLSLVDVVLKKLGSAIEFDAITSAELLPYGKPHPQVYLNCAAQLNCPPVACIAFEDSFNGMIAAKAAKMKCVVVPSKADFLHPKWSAADLKIASLTCFTEQMLLSL